MDPRQSLTSIGFDSKLLGPPSLQRAVEGRARGMLTKFFEDKGLTEVFPSSADYAVDLVLETRPDADTDDGFALLCLILSTPGSHLPADCVPLTTRRVVTHLPPVPFRRPPIVNLPLNLGLLSGIVCGCFGVWYYRRLRRVRVEGG